MRWYRRVRGRVRRVGEQEHAARAGVEQALRQRRHQCAADAAAAQRGRGVDGADAGAGGRDGLSADHAHRLRLRVEPQVLRFEPARPARIGGHLFGGQVDPRLDAEGLVPLEQQRQVVGAGRAQRCLPPDVAGAARRPVASTAARGGSAP
ncbi:MAG: hypothetical protein MZW92_44505 [Comamonadaceae bacterium]|nr:hypothetical protein [Comamonadaceae bacterium]